MGNYEQYTNGVFINARRNGKEHLSLRKMYSLAAMGETIVFCGNLGAYPYVPERTCKPVDVYAVGVLDCDQCGCELARQDEHIPNYCPNCGAKVVK